MAMPSTWLRSLATRGVYCVIFCLAMLPKQSHATWYEEIMEPGADIIMMDLRWPWWPSGTYYANWNTGFETSKGKITFYGGFVSKLEDGPGQTPNADVAKQNAFRPGNVWSFWGGNKDGVSPRFIDCAPNLSFKNHAAGEGCSASLRASPWPFVQCKRWYTMVGRVWVPRDPAAQFAYCGRWINDVENGKWHMVGILKIPFRVDEFGKNQGFIEMLSGEKVVRPLDRRFGYYRKNGEWRQSNRVAVNKRRYVVMQAVPEGDHEYLGIEYSGSPDYLPHKLSAAILPGDERAVVEVKQPDEPALDKPAVKNVQAIHTGKQVVVSWQVPDHAAPFFAYEIEVFGNPECEGVPIAVARRRMPNARHAAIDVDGETPTIRLTASDVFDQKAKPVVVTSKAAIPPPAQEVKKNILPGLEYRLYKRQSSDSKPYWERLADLRDGKVIRQGISRSFDMSIRGSETSDFAVVFEGLLRIPQTGVYIFSARIDGAYRIQVEDKEVIVRDKQDGTTEHAGLCALDEGLHAISVTYLAGTPLGHNFSIDWEGPALSREAIPGSALACVDGGEYPQAVVKAESFGDGTGAVQATLDARGHEVDELGIYLGDHLVAQGNGTEASYRGPLPKGDNDFWIRVRYDGDRSIDQSARPLNVTGKPCSDEWTVRNMGNQGVRSGLWQTGEEDFTFFGTGLHGVFKRMTGDFTVTCRIDEYAKQGVNRDSWVGVAAFENADAVNWKWGRHYYLVQTSGAGMRTSPDHGDLGSSRMSQYSFPSGHPWVRICRQGNLWTAWSSPDGRKWYPGGSMHQRSNETLDAGLFIRVPLHGSEAYYNCRISNLSVDQGIPEVCVFPNPPIAKGTDGNRLTGVVMARSDENVVVVRSSAKGLLRTIDGGKTWKSINGDLSGAANAVRSVAIHPENPNIMFRAAGRAEEGALVSGFWKTTDGGVTWTKLNFAGDFDGYGPSALCGEVFAFDLRDPDRVFVGTESAGFFKSEDEGRTWESLGWQDSRFTAVEVWPWEHINKPGAGNQAHLCATTCTDEWMRCLGRGEPVQSTEAEYSRGLVSKNDVERLHEFHRRADDGFYNIAFSKMMQRPDNFRYATAHGLQHNYGDKLYAFPSYKSIEWLRPVTAIHGTNRNGPEKNNGLMITQALDPEQPGRISRTEKSFARIWHWTDIKGDVPHGGLIAAFGEYQQGEKWWFVYTDGLYSSSNGGMSMVKVLSEAGVPVALIE